MILTLVPFMTNPYETAVHRSVDEARAELRRYREQLGLAGGLVTVAGLAGSVAGLAAALPLAGAAAAGLALLYAFPVSGRARAARHVIREWNGAGAPSASVGASPDARISSAEAMLARVEQYAGPRAASSVSAQAMLQALYDSTEDERAVALLRASATMDASQRHALLQRAQSLEKKVHARMNHALGVIAEIYEAVLARDDIGLREVIARAQAEMDVIQAEDEVSRMLDRA